MAKKAPTKRSASTKHSASGMSRALLGTLIGGVVGTITVVINPRAGATLLVGLITVAAYVFFLNYKRLTDKKWSPRKINGASIFGALIVGVTSLTGVQFLASSSANSIYNTNTATCSIAVVGTSNQIGRSNSQFYESGNNTASTVVVVRGDSSCTKTVTLASWSAPWGKASFLPIADQHLFTSKSYDLKPGTHILSVAHNDCLYQIDMLYGSAVTTTWGDANYPSDQKLGWVQAGNKVCTAPVATPAPTPGPTPAPSPAPAAQTIPTPYSAPAKELPKTGPGNIAIIGLIAGVTGYLFLAVYKLIHGNHSRKV